MEYDVSVIILCYNRIEYTKNCFYSLLDNCPDKTEIVFSDNGSTDGTRNWLKEIKEEYDNVVVVFNSENLFPARGNVEGLKHASKAKAYLFCDNDGLFYTKEWYDMGMLFFHDFPDVGIIGMRRSRWQAPARVELRHHNGIEYKETPRVASFSLLRPEVAEYLIKTLRGRWIGHTIANLAKKINFRSFRFEEGYILDQSDEDLNNPEYREQYEMLWTAKKRHGEFLRRVNILDNEQKG